MEQLVTHRHDHLKVAVGVLIATIVRHEQTGRSGRGSRDQNRALPRPWAARIVAPKMREPGARLDDNFEIGIVLIPWHVALNDAARSHRVRGDHTRLAPRIGGIGIAFRVVNEFAPLGDYDLEIAVIPISKRALDQAAGSCRAFGNDATEGPAENIADPGAPEMYQLATLDECYDLEIAVIAVATVTRFVIALNNAAGPRGLDGYRRLDGDPGIELFARSVIEPKFVIFEHDCKQIAVVSIAGVVCRNKPSALAPRYLRGTAVAAAHKALRHSRDLVRSKSCRVGKADPMHIFVQVHAEPAVAIAGRAGPRHTAIPGDVRPVKPKCDAVRVGLRYRD